VPERATRTSAAGKETGAAGLDWRARRAAQSSGVPKSCDAHVARTAMDAARATRPQSTGSAAAQAIEGSGCRPATAGNAASTGWWSERRGARTGTAAYGKSPPGAGRGATVIMAARISVWAGRRWRLWNGVWAFVSLYGRLLVTVEGEALEASFREM
jgi:hypothetical protein